MKPQELKHKFIELRAEGKSYDTIAEALHISKSTCTAWERELKDKIEVMKQEELKALYTSYSMTKEARIRKLGDTLERVEEALAQKDLQEVAPEKLLDFKLKYTDALKEEYTGSTEKLELGKEVNPKAILLALGDLLDRVRAGEVTTEQANRESLILSNLLKAYDTVEVKAKLDALEAVIGGRG